MKSRLTRLERWVARWLFRRVVKQGYHHFERTEETLEILGDEWGRMFTEDNKPTQVECLEECFYRAMDYRPAWPLPPVHYIFDEKVPAVKLPPYPTPKRMGPEMIRAHQYSDAFEVIKALNPTVKFETVG